MGRNELENLPGSQSLEGRTGVGWGLSQATCCPAYRCAVLPERTGAGRLPAQRVRGRWLGAEEGALEAGVRQGVGRALGSQQDARGRAPEPPPEGGLGIDLCSVSCVSAVLLLLSHPGCMREEGTGGEVLGEPRPRPRGYGAAESHPAGVCAGRSPQLEWVLHGWF